MSRIIRGLAALASLLALVMGIVGATPNALAAGISVPAKNSPGTRTPSTSSNDWVGLATVDAVVLAIALMATVTYLQHRGEASSAEAESSELVEVGVGG